MKKPTPIRLSIPASQAFAHLRKVLDEHPAFLHDVTASVAIEFLCAQFLEGATMLTFRPETQRGRPRGMFYADNLRPGKVRKAAGLTKTEATLGPERDGC